jgi:hypothetical protein
MLSAYGLASFTELRVRSVQKPLAHGHIVKGGAQLRDDRVRLCLVMRRRLHLLMVSIMSRERCMGLPGDPREVDTMGHLQGALKRLFRTVSSAAGRQALSDNQ